MQGGFERQRDGIKISETHLTRHQFLLDRKCPRDTSPFFTRLGNTIFNVSCVYVVGLFSFELTICSAKGKFFQQI
ncbi:hypothetical protein CDAR_521961 [Caerostris darwini]|uniref:Uncharacterized protein n=1 Tax=Caerostris darwini TaxID=1538125 RepID=A0AAV4SP30_9ARAC|nr:hypothetical protein CDAR_521961 [Caerostris darwini]